MLALQTCIVLCCSIKISVLFNLRLKNKNKTKQICICCRAGTRHQKLNLRTLIFPLTFFCFAIVFRRTKTVVSFFSLHEFEFNVALRPQRPYGQLETWSPGRPPRLSHSSGQVQCFFTSTETVRTMMNGEPRTSTSTFTQLLCSERTH